MMPLLLLAIAPSVSALSFPSLRTPHDVDFRSLGDLSIALGPQSASYDRAGCMSPKSEHFIRRPLPGQPAAFRIELHKGKTPLNPTRYRAGGQSLES